MRVWPRVSLSGGGTVTPAQGELFALEPAQVTTTCLLPARMGSRIRCTRPPDGTVPDWRAPLDTTLATPACEECAQLYGLELDRWLL